jgi:hypothetical protein
MIDDIDFNNPDKRNYLKSILKDTFYTEGEHTYSIYIYDCQDINKEFETDDCSRLLDPEDIISNMKPLKSKSKTITVTE